MVDRISELMREKIEGISDLRRRNPRARGCASFIELKRDALPRCLNQLYRFTPLQSNFPATCWRWIRPAADDEPEDMLTLFVAFESR